MIPTNFEYFAPSTLDEALRLLAEHGDEGKILAGGHSLLPILKLRLAAPAVLIDIGRIPALKTIGMDGDVIRIGAMATHAAIARHAELQQHCPILAEAAQQIGDQQVRNCGTIGGSLAHADPAADWPAVMLALEAAMVARSARGERVIKAADFFVDVMTSAIEPDEIVTEIRIPQPAQPRAAAYLKVIHPASGFAVIGVAAQLKLNNGQCEDASIGVTGLAPKAFRAAALENELRGKALDEAALSSAASKADAEAIDTMEDLHASGDYRRHLARVYAKRAVQQAAARA